MVDKMGEALSRGNRSASFLCVGKVVGVRKMEASRVVLVVVGLKKA